MNLMLKAALAYATRGWHVLPVRGKVPLTEHGVRDATVDTKTIRSWWSRWPEAGVAIATGRISGIWVLDIDPRNGGNESLFTLELELGDIDASLIALTPSGGQHFYYAYPPDVTVPSRNGLRPGIDVKSDGGYVVAPPSPAPDDREWIWEAAHDFEDLEP